MLIERIDIESFGKLKNVQLVINNRMNVICGKNDSGKSTLAAFIKFIFYGFDNTVEPSEQKLYMPWNGGKVAGSIVFHFKEKKYKIEREFADREKIRIIDLTSNISIYNGIEPGEFFFRMSGEVYAKTSFLGQLGGGETGGADLSDMIQNILFSADEDINIRKAVGELHEAKEKLWSEDQTSGNIAVLTRKNASLNNSLEKSLENQREMLKLESQIKMLEERTLANNAKSNELDEELENYKAYHASQELQRIENTRRQTNILKEAYDRLVERYKNGDFLPTQEYSRKLAELGTKVDAEKKKLDEILVSRNRAFESYSACEEKNKSFKIIEQAGGIEQVGSTYALNKRNEKIFFALIIVSFIICVLSGGFAAALYVLKNFLIFLKIPSVILSALSLGLGVISIPLRLGTKKKIEEEFQYYSFANELDFAAALDDYSDTESQLATLTADLDLYNEMSAKAEIEFSKIYAEAKEYLLIWDKTTETDDRTGGDFLKFSIMASEAAEELDNAKSIYDQYKSKYEEMMDGVDEKELIRLASIARKPNYEENQINKDLNLLKRMNESIKVEESEISKNITDLALKLPDPSVLVSQINLFTKKTEELIEKHAILGETISLIEESCADLKSNISPRLSDISSKLFSLVTSGAYNDLSISPQFDLNTNDGLTVHPINMLSASARDSAYLCLRMALLDLLFDNMPPALICDESFTRLDNERLDSMAKVLFAYTKRGQVFIFTAHQREINAFKKYDAAIMQI